MAETTVSPEMAGLNSRVEVLEQIGADTREVLADMRNEMRAGFTDIRSEMRIGFNDMRSESRGIRVELRSDYRWLLGIVLGQFATLFAVMAHGFHWL